MRSVKFWRGRNRGRFPALRRRILQMAGMDQDNIRPGSQVPDVPLVPAAAIGFLLYAAAVQLVLANPPANDPGALPRRR